MAVSRNPTANLFTWGRRSPFLVGPPPRSIEYHSPGVFMSPDKRNLGSGSATFPQCMWICLCGVTKSIWEQNRSRTLCQAGNPPAPRAAAREEFSPTDAMKNIATSAILLQSRATKPFIEWCNGSHWLQIKSLLHFLVDVSEKINSLVVAVQGLRSQGGTLCFPGWGTK